MLKVQEDMKFSQIDEITELYVKMEKQYANQAVKAILKSLSTDIDVVD
mgnify:CR=1 FL=1